MGNTVFRYFLDWLRVQMREEAYRRYVKQAKHTAAARAAARGGSRGPFWRGRALYRGLVHPKAAVLGILEDDDADDDGTWDEEDLDELAWVFGSHGEGEDDQDFSTAEQTDDDEEEEKQKEEEEQQQQDSTHKYPKLYELAKVEGDTEWIDWLGESEFCYLDAKLCVLQSCAQQCHLCFHWSRKAHLDLCGFGGTSAWCPRTTAIRSVRREYGTSIYA